MASSVYLSPTTAAKRRHNNRDELPAQQKPSWPHRLRSKATPAQEGLCAGQHHTRDIARVTRPAPLAVVVLSPDGLRDWNHTELLHEGEIVPEVPVFHDFLTCKANEGDASECYTFACRADM